MLDQYEHDALVTLATRLATSARERDTLDVARVYLAWMRRHIVYVPSPVNEQRIVAPLPLLAEIRTMGRIGTDCVNVAMLAGCLCLAVGMPVMLVGESYDPGDLRLAHVYAMVQTPTRWVALDTQRQPDAPARRVWRREGRNVP